MTAALGRDSAKGAIKRPRGHFACRNIHHGPIPVQGDGDQGEDADVDAKGLREGAEPAHEGRQVPPLQEGRVKLEGDAEDGDDDVRRGQVRDVEVDDVAHGAGARHHADDEAVAADGQQRDEPVAAAQQGHHA